MTLKLATQEDVPVVVEMALRYAKASPFGRFPVDEAKINQIVQDLMRDRNKGIIVLYIVNDKPEGMIAGMLTEMLFNHDAIATELVWWVNPEHRTRKSLKLKEAYEYWAKRVGAKFIQMAEMNDDKIRRFYERTGYDLTERAYLKVIGG
jgi:hypothetical protein